MMLGKFSISDKIAIYGIIITIVLFVIPITYSYINKQFSSKPDIYIQGCRQLESHKNPSTVTVHPIYSSKHAKKEVKESRVGIMIFDSIKAGEVYYNFSVQNKGTKMDENINIKIDFNMQDIFGEKIDDGVEIIDRMGSFIVVNIPSLQPKQTLKFHFFVKGSNIPKIEAFSSTYKSIRNVYLHEIILGN